MYLLPAPQEIHFNNEKYILNYETKIILQSNLENQEYNYAKILKNHIKNKLGYDLSITKKDNFEKNNIFLEITKNLNDEQYELKIEHEGIKIIGGNSRGLLYGIQTLRQIISQEKAILSGITINDYPQILNRGFYHDVTRGRIPTLETLKKLADKLSYYKINQLQLYVEHSFLFEDFSEMLRDDTPLTAEEILEFDQYCKTLNIELVPSIATFGHLHKLLSTKTYSHLCELENSNNDIFSYVGRMMHHTIDVTNEESFKVIEKMLLEFIPLFSSNQFNICADETFDLGKGKSKKLSDEIGVHKVYVDFLKKICDVVKSKNKRPMFWGDIIIEKPEMIKELPSDVICLNWDYSTEAKETNVKKLYDLGVTQYLCPGVHGWKHLINRFDHAYDNISKMANYAQKYNVSGFLNTDWGDFGHINDAEFSTAGMIYGATFSWNDKQISIEDINREISLIEYGDKSQQFLSIAKEISSNEAFYWGAVVEYKEMCEKNIEDGKLREHLINHNIENILELNKNIEKEIENLYSVISEIDSQKINVIKKYLVASRGIVLLNELGAVIGKYLHSIDVEVKEEPKKLAISIENWFRDYSEIWRSDNKESELFLVRDVIVWYADLLREI